MDPRKSSSSIEELENNFWPDLENYPTALVEKVYKYRKIPINRLTPSQIRLLIGQNEGLPYLVPLALPIVKKNPVFEATFYPSDLLFSLISADLERLENTETVKIQLKGLCSQALEILEKKPPFSRQLLRGFRAFIEK